MRATGPGRVTAGVCLVIALLTSVAGVEARELANADAVELGLGDVRRALALGDNEAAVHLATELLGRFPDDERAFWGLARAYAQAGVERDGLIPLLENRLSMLPGNRKAVYELAAAYARIGERDRAHAMWRDMLEARRADPGSYADVGSLEMHYGMHEDAIETFLRGRERLEDRTFFSQELARAYVTVGDHGHVIDECLVVVNEHPGMVQWATNLVELMLESGERGDRVKSRADKIVGGAATPPELSFAGSMYVLTGRFDDALQAYLRSDELGGRRGRELLEHAYSLRDRHLLLEARNVFRVIIERHPGSVNAALAGIGAADLLVELGRPADAVVELKRVAAAFNSRADGGEALLLAARIELEQMSDPEAALATVASIDREFPRRAVHLAEEAAMIAVDAHMALGDLDTAYRLAAELQERNPREGVAERAAFARGYISFLRHDARRALEEFRGMVEEHLSGKLVNDALRLMLVISDAEEAGDDAMFTMFADARAALLTGETELAAGLLAQVVRAYPKATVASEAMMLRGGLAEMAGDPEAALSIYGRIVTEIEAIAVRAEAMMRRGRILKNMDGRESEAIAQFQAVLDDLPPNWLSGEARREIERVRRKERR
jgi:tetratricopeptide (TPR) repeat protein